MNLFSDHLFAKGAYVVYELVLRALVHIAFHPQVGAEPEGLNDCEGGGVDVILLYIPHHSSQSGLALRPPVQLLLTAASTTCHSQSQ